MLRYKVYQLVTHNKFPYFAFICSLFLYIASVYILLNPPLLNINSFISENAVSPSLQIPRLDSVVTSSSIKDFTQYKSSSIYYFYHKSPRTPLQDCIALLFAYDSPKVGIQLALTIKKHFESVNWGGDILFVLYKKEKYAREFRDFHNNTLGQFGVIRCYFDFDVSEQYTYFTISPDGLNGVQTDLDQVQAIITLFRISKLEFRFPEMQFSGKLSQSFTSLSKVLMPDLDSPHSYLISFGYVAIKISTVSTRKMTNINLLQTGRLVELIVRTFTALDENLHAGYYFYFFTSQNHILPLSKSALLIGALVSPLLFQSILVLKVSWFDSSALYNLILPYFWALICYYVPVTRSWLCIAIPEISCLLAAGSNKIYKAYSNLILGCTIVILSIRCIPLSFMLCILVPVRLLLPVYKSKFVLMLLLGLCFVGIYNCPLEELLEIENNAGHYLYFIIIFWINPVICHSIIYFA